MPQFNIVGYNHILFMTDILKTIPNGAALSLVPEPNNKFDRNAIMVMCDPGASNWWADAKAALDAKAIGSEHYAAPFRIGYIRRIDTRLIRKIGATQGIMARSKLYKFPMIAIE
jgi:hypothetical protein